MERCAGVLANVLATIVSACVCHLVLRPKTALIIVRPIFFSSPDLVVGMPVSMAICRFTLSIPNARLSENDTPGILIFFDIIQYYYSTYTE